MGFDAYNIVEHIFAFFLFFLGSYKCFYEACDDDSGKKTT